MAFCQAPRVNHPVTAPAVAQAHQFRLHCASPNANEDIAPNSLPHKQVNGRGEAADNRAVGSQVVAGPEACSLEVECPVVGARTMSGQRWTRPVDAYPGGECPVGECPVCQRLVDEFLVDEFLVGECPVSAPGGRVLVCQRRAA